MPSLRIDRCPPAPRIPRAATLAFGAAAILFGAACESTYRTRSVEESGFLRNYSQLREGGKDEAQLLYVAPDADFSKYTKIMMDPVAIYAAEKTLLGGVSPEDQQALVDYLDAAIREKLSPNYEFVDAAGPDVLRLRVAVTEAKGARVLLNVVSSVVPQALAVSTLKRIALGTHSAVAKTSAEVEMLDSLSGKRLAAAVDERAARKFAGPAAKLSKWEQVRDAFDFWAERIALRLEKARQGLPENAG